MECEILVIGAGISGLSFGHFAKEQDFLIFEKEDKIGGLCRTIKQDGFTWDYSGHFMHFRNDEMRDYLKNLIDDELIYHQKRTKIFYKDQMIDFPFQMNIHQLPKDEFLECLYDLFFTTSEPPYRNFKEMLIGKFGKAICDKFLYPYNEKLYQCDLLSLDKDAMGRFFPHAEKLEIIENFKFKNNASYNQQFFYPKNGIEKLVEALSSNIERTKINTNSTIVRIDPINKIAYTDDISIKYEKLISTVPLPILLRLINYKHDFNFSYNKVIVLNLGFDKPNNFNHHWIYIPDKNYKFYRIGFYDNILNEQRMSCYVEIGMKKSDVIEDEQMLIDETLDGLRKLGFIDDHELVSYKVLKIDPAYVHISKESEIFVKGVKDDLSNMEIYVTGRYAEWTYCSIEDNIINAKSLSVKFDESYQKN